METKPFDGPVSQMRESEYLSSEDLEDPNGQGYREVVVEIESVQVMYNVTFRDGRKSNRKFGVKFKGKERLLVLNGVNRETLKEMFGRRAADWIGHKVTLYVKQDVMLMGKKVPGLRVKAAPQNTPLQS